MTIGILIVDDSDYMRRYLKKMLDDDEYEIVAEATNGAWAVQLYKEHQEEIDLVMMDIVMRKANGVKATAAIRRLDSDANILMCTSVGQKKKMELAARAGADGYVTKPFDESDIREAIDHVLAR